LAQRAQNKVSNPGKWGPAVAGTIDKGESYKDNIVKEAQEEIGLTNVDFILGPKVFISHQRRYFCQWYYAKSDLQESDFKIPKDEVNAVKWVAPDKLLKDAKENPTKYVTDYYSKAKTLIHNQPQL
jgi:isopentenyldiphosphate isomerase